MSYPVDCFDMQELVIQRMINSPIELSEVINEQTVDINNVGNTTKNPIITITLNDIFLSGFTLTNSTTGISIVIPTPPNDGNYPQGSIFTIYNDSAYLDDEEISATFSAPFIIAEDSINTLIFLLPTSFTVDCSISWSHPSTTEKIVTFAQNFTLNETRSQKKGSVNLLNKFTDKYTTQDISYDFTIDRLWIDAWFQDEEENDSTYRISWQTDDEITNIEQMKYYLCDCSFNNLSWNQADNDVIKEGIKGVACKKIKG